MNEKAESGNRKSGIENRKSKMENRHAYLSYDGPGDRIISGVGLFARGIPAEPVSVSIANQYSTDEMKALGWKVEWRDGVSSS